MGGRHGIALALFVVACSREGAPTPKNEAPTMTSAPDAARPPIGVASMQPDGTLVLDLHATAGGARGEARKVYPPTHAEYKRVLDHLGGLKPGESKPVPPWPDPWDAAKVEAAAHAHAAAKGWSRSDYTLEITGTDADGNAVVTLTHADDKRGKAPGGGKSVQVRVETKGYTVARELRFQ
jgi:hypothetical protein